ncbi:MAG: ATP-binding cassette domain-containing protein [Spirochaetota bacterium]
MNEKIIITNLYKSFGTQLIFTGLNLSVYKGEILCIIGKSGTGKSVLLKHCIGILKPDSGSIVIDGTPLAYNDSDARVLKKFGVLFQGGALFDSMSVYDNIAFPLRRQGVSDIVIAQKVPELLAHVGCTGIEAKMPSELSGGIQKRVALARAIAKNPEIMLYDEPTTGVDPITAGSINRLIVYMRNTFSMTSVVVTHDMRLALNIADRIAMLHNGTIIFEGTPQQIVECQDSIVRQFIAGKASA